MNFVHEVISSPIDVRDYRINAAKNLPETYDCPITLQIKNQGSKPTCVAHALASLAEYHYKKQFNTSRVFSTEFIYGFRDVGYYVGDGMMLRDALKTLANVGDPFKSECPGNNDYQKAMQNVNDNIEKYRELAYPHRISTYYRCKSNDEIKTALMNHGPVAISMNTYQHAGLENDVYTWDPNDDYGRHCVLIIGWNETGWIIQNSWGKSHAEDGKFTLPYSFKLNEAWGITDSIIDDDTLIRKPNAFVSWMYKVWNALANFIINTFTK